MNLQELITKAKEEKQKGALKVALDYYNEAFDILIRESNEYARKQKGAAVEEGDTLKVMPKAFEESKKYLKRDKTAAIISNNMGVLFAELRDYKNADEFFRQAIELTPDGVEYKDPHKNLRELKEDLMDVNTLSKLSVEKQVEILNKVYPLVPHTNAGRLSSTVRRMKVEKELGIPMGLRFGSVTSVKTGKRANEMSEQEWESFYNDLADQFKRDYPELYKKIFNSERL